MKIEKNHVVLFHYDVSDDAGNALDTSRPGEPVAVLHGHGNVMPGLEAALAGREAGERFEVEVPPEQGYGPRREDWTQRVPKKWFEHPKRLKPGATARVQTRDGVRMVTILKLGQTVVDVDLNHPMAGRTLRFAVEVMEVRAAQPEEITHGHVHGAGGHQH